MGQTHHVRVQGINSTQAKSVFRDHDTGLGIYRHWFTCPTKKKNLQHSNMQKARKWIYRKIRLLRNTPKTIHFIPVIHAYHIQLVICNRIQAIATFFSFSLFFFSSNCYLVKWFTRELWEVASLFYTKVCHYMHIFKESQHLVRSLVNTCSSKIINSPPE